MGLVPLDPERKTKARSEIRVIPFAGHAVLARSYLRPRGNPEYPMKGSYGHKIFFLRNIYHPRQNRPSDRQILVKKQTRLFVS